MNIAEPTSLPLEAWDMIIGCFDSVVDLYWMSLVCMNFSILVKRWLYPQLQLVNTYDFIYMCPDHKCSPWVVPCPSQRVSMSDFFINEEGIPCAYSFERVRKNHYEVQSNTFHPEKGHFIRKRDKEMYIDVKNKYVLAVDSEYLVLLDETNDISNIAIIKVWDKDAPTIVYVNYMRGSLYTKFIDGNLFIAKFRMNAYSTYECNNIYYHDIKNEENIIEFIGDITLKQLNIQCSGDPLYASYVDNKFFSMVPCKIPTYLKKRCSFKRGQNVHRDVLDIVKIKNSRTLGRYFRVCVMDSRGLLITGMDKTISIYAGSCLLARIDIDVPIRNIACCRLRGQNYVHVMGQNRIFIYKY